jgi:RimJ/RimL family protein N-acetyltransferase
MQTDFSFTPLTTADLTLLHEWMSRPHWVEWWGEPGPPEAVRAEYGAMIADTAKVQPYIAWVDGRRLGYIQSYVAMGSGGGWWEDETDPGVRGIDQSIAHAADLGRGLGTGMVKAFVKMLFSDAQVTRVQTDPDPRNARAIRCYQKAGFQPIREVTTPDGAALQMICERPGPCC